MFSVIRHHTWLVLASASMISEKQTERQTAVIEGAMTGRAEADEAVNNRHAERFVRADESVS